MTVSKDQVIVVDEQDRQQGIMEKMEAHRQGVLHRAFSVFILNKNNELLLQQRAAGKYHSAGLWSNACCSHPRPGEDTMKAAHRRLQEEMGFDCVLEPVFSLRYRSEVGSDMIENEYDHIFLGHYNGPVIPDSAEVSAYTYQSLSQIADRLKTEPSAFTSWFHLALPKLTSYLQANKVPVKP